MGKRSERHNNRGFGPASTATSHTNHMLGRHVAWPTRICPIYLLPHLLDQGPKSRPINWQNARIVRMTVSY